jgi:TonB family protein
MKIILLAVCLFLGLSARPVVAQTTEPPIPDLDELTGPIVVPRDTSLVFIYVEQMPRLPVGKGAPVNSDLAIAQRLQQLVRLPREVQTGTVKGEVIISFIVRPDGYVRDVQIVQPLSPACDAAARRAVAALPRLVPGYQSKVAVNTSLRISLRFAAPTVKQLGK